MGSKKRAGVCVFCCVCTACNLWNNRAAYTRRIRDRSLTAEQITHSGNKLCVCMCICRCVCVCECVSVGGGVRRLLPTHVSNTKPSNCPHDQREEDQPGRNRLMDRDWARINEKESGRSTAV